MIYFYIAVAVAILILSLLHVFLKRVVPAKTRGEHLVEIMKEKDEELYEIMKSISLDLDCTLESVVFTHYALIKDTETVNDSDMASENFIILVNDLYSNAKKGLLSLQLRSTEELDNISKRLEEKKIIKLSKGFSFSSLDQFFGKEES